MGSIKKEITTLDRYQSFMVFDPASVRISDNDIFLIGNEVKDMYDKVYESVLNMDNTIQRQIMSNQIQKLGNMLDLLDSYDNLIITKFFDRVWRRYSYVSHLGESFLKLSMFLDFFPTFDSKQDTIVAKRIDEAVKEFEESEDDSDSDSDTNSDDDGSVKGGSGETEEESIADEPVLDS